MEHLTEEQISELCQNTTPQDPLIHLHLKSCSSCLDLYNQAVSGHEQLQNLEYQRPSMRFSKNIVELIKLNNKLNKASILWNRIIIGSLLAVSLLIVLSLSYQLMSVTDFNDETLSSISNWTMIFFITAVFSWIIYFIDRWLGKNILQQVQIRK